MSQHLKLTLLFLFIFSGFSLVGALGIAPSKVYYNYEPGKVIQEQFVIFNSEKRTEIYDIAADGELGKYIKFENDSIEFDFLDERANVTYNLLMPAGLSSGSHFLDVSVTPKTKDGADNGFVTGVVVVSANIEILVPFEGKYAESNLKVFPDDENGIKFVLPVLNRGEEELEGVYATIEVYDFKDMKVLKTESKRINLEKAKRKELVVFPSFLLDNGSYLAEARVFFGGGVLLFRKEFDIGEPHIELLAGRAERFSLGEIVKLDFFFDSPWKGDINNARVFLVVKDKSGEIISSTEPRNFDFSPLAVKRTEIFWDTEGLKEGDYDAELVFELDDYKVREEFNVLVKDNSLKFKGLNSRIMGKQAEIIEKIERELFIFALALLAATVVFVLFRKLRKRFYSKR